MPNAYKATFSTAGGERGTAPQHYSVYYPTYLLSLLIPAKRMVVQDKKKWNNITIGDCIDFYDDTLRICPFPRVPLYTKIVGEPLAYYANWSAFEEQNKHLWHEYYPFEIDREKYLRALRLMFARQFGDVEQGFLTFKIQKL